MAFDPRYEQRLITELLTYKDDPLAFMQFVFPWGQKNTPLERVEGPRGWQVDELNRIADFIQAQKERFRKGDPYLVYQSATASGRGVGKSALVAWIIWWFMSTRLGGNAVISANSEAQLKSKTWGELGKWNVMAINRHWFERSALSLKPNPWFVKMLSEQLSIDSTYFAANATLWNEDAPDSFAGMHTHYGELVIFDEASGIAQCIWDITDGFFTDPIPDRFWFAFSNPRRNKGAFYDCFHGRKEYWHTRMLDSRDVEGTDHTKLEQMVVINGEDSDVARVEVKGMFPNTSEKQFINRDKVDEAMARSAEDMFDPADPLIMGVDPARFGVDASVICFRRGRVNRPPYVPPKMDFRGLDNMQLADKIAGLINEHNPDAVCIDAGQGIGIIDRLKQKGFKGIHEVWFGGKSADSQRYLNKRVEMWGKMRDWIDGAALDDNVELRSQLTSPEFKYSGSSDKLVLESKDDMKKRGAPSPDYADALACTFWVNIAKKNLHTSKNGINGVKKPRMAIMDYDIFGG